MRLALALIVISLGVVGCTGGSGLPASTDESTVSDERPIEAAEQPTSTGAPSSLDVVTAPPADCTGYETDFSVREGVDHVVKVALLCEHNGGLHLVDRVVPADADQMAALVEQLFLGMTSDEAAAGLHSSFTPYTAGQFDDVRMGADGVVVVDLGTGFVTANNFSTSSRSTTGVLGRSIGAFVPGWSSAVVRDGASVAGRASVVGRWHVGGDRLVMLSRIAATAISASSTPSSTSRTVTGLPWPAG